MSHRIKVLSYLELKLKFIPKAWKRETIVHKTPLKGCSLKTEILTRILFFFI